MIFRGPSDGERNHLVTVQEPRASNVKGQMIDVPTDVGTEWVEVATVGGGEMLRGVQFEAGIDTLVTSLFRTYITPGMWFVHEGRQMNIVKAADPDGKRHWLVCQCKERVAT